MIGLALSSSSSTISLLVNIVLDLVTIILSLVMIILASLNIVYTPYDISYFYHGVGLSFVLTPSPTPLLGAVHPADPLLHPPHLRGPRHHPLHPPLRPLLSQFYCILQSYSW